MGEFIVKTWSNDREACQLITVLKKWSLIKLRENQFKGSFTFQYVKEESEKLA